MSHDRKDPNRHEVAWNQYWQQQDTTTRAYGKIASFYRRMIISPSLRRTLSRFVTADSSLLHAGAGGGEIDVSLPADWNLHSLDISFEAVQLQQKVFKTRNRNSVSVQGDLFSLPFPHQAFDVVFNLGVMEHFTNIEIHEALTELKRVMKSDGYLVLYWPPVWGPSVLALHVITRIISFLGRSRIQLHPEEINLFNSKRECRKILRNSGFLAERITYGPGDLFTHVIVIARPM
jgi:ubiquinone/menaquinone biosynthesis C-methylase UbiE